MQMILLEGRARLQLDRRCHNHSLVLTPNVFTAQSPKQIGTGDISSHTHSIIVAVTGVVPRACSHVSATASPPTRNGESPHPGAGIHHAPQHPSTSPKGIATSWLSGIEQVCILEAQTVLLNGRKPTTRKSYLQK